METPINPITGEIIITASGPDVPEDNSSVDKKPRGKPFAKGNKEWEKSPSVIGSRAARAEKELWEKVFTLEDEEALLNVLKEAALIQRSTKAAQYLLDRRHGKAKQTIDSTVITTTPEEQRARLDEMLGIDREEFEAELKKLEVTPEVIPGLENG